MKSLQALILANKRFENSLLVDSNQQCTLFTDFSPNPGGQTRLFQLVPLQELNPHIKQRWTGMIGGLGSGKSFCGAVWAISRALIDPTSRGLISANTFGQLSRSTLITLVEVARLFHVPLEPFRSSIEDQALAIANSQRCYIGKERAFVYVLSMSSFTGKTQASRGLQCRWCWGDEWGYSSEKSFLTLDARIGRGPGILSGQGLVSTSPNGMNWLYDRFADPQRGPEKERLYVMVNCSTRENVKHLGEDYVAGLQANYTEELAAQELEGAFVNITVGRVYKSFLRSRDILQGRDAIDFGYNPQEDIHISLDFNWNPACAVAAHVRNKQEVFFVREFRLANSDTFELSDAICKWLLETGHRGRIFVHGDASGAARSANSRLTNWEIVWNALKSHGLKERASKCYGIQNPNVLDTVLSVNSLFAHERMFICGDRCPNLVKDLEQVAWKDDGTTVDKSNPELTHLSDCLRYLVYDEFPYKRQVSSLRTAPRPVAGISL